MKLNEAIKQVLIGEDIYMGSGKTPGTSKAAFKRIVSFLEKKKGVDFTDESANVDYTEPHIDASVGDYTIHIDGEKFPRIDIWVQGSLPEYKIGEFNAIVGYDSPKFWDIIKNFDTDGYLKLKLSKGQDTGKWSSPSW